MRVFWIPGPRDSYIYHEAMSSADVPSRCELDRARGELRAVNAGRRPDAKQCRSCNFACPHFPRADVIQDLDEPTRPVPLKI